MPDLAGLHAEVVDTGGFLRYLGDLEAQTKGKRRKDLTAPQLAELDKREKQLVTLTGYLVLAYAGPPESTNCASSDFHDWHLEVFAQPLDHPPAVGDPTPIICEITPRTQTAIYRAGTRLQELAAFIRAPDLSHEPTKHPARKVRLTGYLLWDDEHNGAADIGRTIRSFSANGYHQPWRSSAWEMHPVVKIELLEPGTPTAVTGSIKPSPTPESASTPKIVQVAPPPETVTPSQPAAYLAKQEATLTRPVAIKVPYGSTVIPRGMRLPVVSRGGSNVTVRYLGQLHTIPVDSTDLK